MNEPIIGDEERTRIFNNSVLPTEALCIAQHERSMRFALALVRAVGVLDAARLAQVFVDAFRKYELRGWQGTASYLPSEPQATDLALWAASRAVAAAVVEIAEEKLR